MAASDPDSVAFNDPIYGDYYANSQTSVLEVAQEFNTNKAVTPKLAFDIAYTFEEPLPNSIPDFLVVEVLRRGQSQYELLDINGDGQVVSDLTAVGSLTVGPLRDAGTFDGFYGTSQTQDHAGQHQPLAKQDFVHVEVDLPKNDSLKIAFRFQSDPSSYFYEGAYLDNIRIYDSGGSGGAEPRIAGVVNRDGGSIYVDTETRAAIRGKNLSPVEQVVFKSRDGEVQLPFQEQAGDVWITLPRLSQPLTDEMNATLKVIRKDQVESALFTFAMTAAPKPVIQSISPSTLFLNGSDYTLRIHGNHFRPAFPGATDSDGSRVLIGQNGKEVVYSQSADFNSRNLTDLVLDVTELRTFSAGVVDVTVENGYSGLASAVFQLQLENGSGALQVDSFLIEMGGTDFDPTKDILPMQRDQSFTLLWVGSGFSTTTLNIDINGVPVVAAGNPVGTVNGATINVLIGPSNVNLGLSPYVIAKSGTVSTSIRLGNGQPIVQTFTISDSLPPVLYHREINNYYIYGDWNTYAPDRSSTDSNDLHIYGDNFRGLTNGMTTSETVTRIFLLPVAGGDPIPLPSVDSFSIQITPIIADNPQGEDALIESVPGGTVPPGTYRLRVLNPDSGLYADSPPNLTITFK